jgi:hypothetical protein
MAKAKHYNQVIVERAVKDAKDKWGRGWQHLASEQKRAEIALRVVYIIGSWLHQEDNPAVDICNRAVAAMIAEGDAA